MVQPQGGLPSDCSVAVEDCVANPGRPRCWRGSPEAHHRRVGSRTASTSSEESPSRPQAPAAAGGEPFSALFRWLRTSQWRCDAKGNEGYHAIFPNISVAFPKFYCDRSTCAAAGGGRCSRGGSAACLGMRGASLRGRLARPERARLGGMADRPRVRRVCRRRRRQPSSASRGTRSRPTRSEASGARSAQVPGG